MPLRDEIVDIDETDPARVIIQIDQKLRPEIEDVEDGKDVQKVVKYYSRIAHACDVFSVDFYVTAPAQIDTQKARSLFYATTGFVDQLKITTLRQRIGVPLDEVGALRYVLIWHR